MKYDMYIDDPALPALYYAAIKACDPDKEHLMHLHAALCKQFDDVDFFGIAGEDVRVSLLNYGMAYAQNRTDYFFLWGHESDWDLDEWISFRIHRVSRKENHTMLSWMSGNDWKRLSVGTNASVRSLRERELPRLLGDVALYVSRDVFGADKPMVGTLECWRAQFKALRDWW